MSLYVIEHNFESIWGSAWLGDLIIVVCFVDYEDLIFEATGFSLGGSPDFGLAFSIILD